MHKKNGDASGKCLVLEVLPLLARDKRVSLGLGNEKQDHSLIRAPFEIGELGNQVVLRETRAEDREYVADDN